MIPESRPFHAFIEPARQRGEWWRVLLGLIVIGTVWFGFGYALYMLIATDSLAPVGLGAEAVMALGAEGREMTPAGVLFFLLTFLGLWLGLFIATRGLHRRPFGTLFHPSGRTNRRNLLRGAALALGFYAIGLIAYIAVLGPPERTDMPVSGWAVWIIPIILAIVMQASSEELLFRGYILQHFAVWSRNPIIWAIIPSIIFTMLHYDAGMESEMRSRMLIHILIFGLVAAVLVWRTGGLGAAIGLHVANNIMAISGAGIDGSALGFELWVFPADTLERMFLFDLGTGILILAAAFILFRPEDDR